ncbi:MAG: hypothetical protein ACRENS_10260, partial [Candidatus Eiseniibacteriota bacterium]
RRWTRRAIAMPLLIAIAVLTPLAVATLRPAKLSAQPQVELDAARLEAPFLRAHLAPDETAMVNITSYFAWFADRPMAELVIADSVRFAASVQRLKTRWAVLPDDAIPELAARYPEGRLPGALHFDHTSAAPGFTVYRVDAAAEPAPRPPASLPVRRTH